MKKVLKPIIVVVLFIGAISAIVLMQAKKPHPQIVLTGNSDQKAIEIFPHAYQCSKCKMDIVDTKFAAQLAQPNGKTIFFDDIGCLALWLSEHPKLKSEKIWVYALDTKKWIDAKSAHYLTSEKTPMHYGFGAYEQKIEKSIDFDEVVNRMKDGRHMANPEYAKKIREN